MSLAAPLYHIKSGEPEPQSRSRTMTWAVMLAIMLVGARVLAISTGHSRIFWIIWSAIVGLIAFISPVSGVAISAGNVFISLDDNSPLGLSVGQLAGAGAVVRMFLQLAIRRVRIFQVWRPGLFALAGIVFVVLLSAVVSPFPRIPWSPVRKLLLIILLYLLTLAYVNSFAKLLFLHLTVTLCAGITAALTIGQVVTGTDLIEERAVGLAGNPNYQAIYLAVAMPLAISLGSYFRSLPWRVLSGGVGIALVGGVIATASRGGLTVLGISLLLVLMIWGKHGKRAQLFLGVLLTVLVLGLTRGDFGDYALLRFDEALSSLREGTASQTQSRVKLTNESLDVWQRYPVLGVGAGNWLWGVTQLESRTTAITSPHVWPAQILAELGLLGLGCYVSFVLLCVRDYRNIIHTLDQQSSPHVELVRGVFAAAMAMTFAWTSGNPYNQLWFEFLMLGGICLYILEANNQPSRWQSVQVKPAAAVSSTTGSS